MFKRQSASLGKDSLFCMLAASALVVLVLTPEPARASSYNCGEGGGQVCRKVDACIGTPNIFMVCSSTYEYYPPSGGNSDVDY